MNQTLEISLKAYAGPNWDNWAQNMDALALSYNSTLHTVTGFTPAYLLRGYVPISGSSLIHLPECIPCPVEKPKRRIANDLEIVPEEFLHPEALEMIELFTAERHQAQEALHLGQHFQK